MAFFLIYRFVVKTCNHIFFPTDPRSTIYLLFPIFSSQNNFFDSFSFILFFGVQNIKVSAFMRIKGHWWSPQWSLVIPGSSNAGVSVLVSSHVTATFWWLSGTPSCDLTIRHGRTIWHTPKSEPHGSSHSLNGSAIISKNLTPANVSLFCRHLALR